MVRAGKAVRLRLERIAGTRLTKDGEIVLTAANFRTQEANRREARMIRQAAIERPVRTPTRPTLGSKRRRLAGIAKRGEVKRQRRAPSVAPIEAAGQIAPLRIGFLGRIRTRPSDKIWAA